MLIAADVLKKRGKFVLGDQNSQLNGKGFYKEERDFDHVESHEENKVIYQEICLQIRFY